MRDIYIAKDADILVTQTVALEFIKLLRDEDEREIRVFGNITVVPDGTQEEE
ncbi:MAG: hypothetical protein GY700_03635 [Propionibacteriaceae bacterium]|nr:hypothetical protein [Propionibacteriaceae bacterium]